MKTLKGAGWLGTVALMVLVARWLAYALAQPSPLANRFASSAGGPSLVLVSVVTLALAGAISVTVLWLVALGVRERQLLRPDRVPPRLRFRRLALTAAGLYVSGSLAFAMFESYLHWRAGIAPPSEARPAARSARGRAAPPLAELLAGAPARPLSRTSGSRLAGKPARKEFK